ncbi:hypothetical protein R6Q59_029233 [Mikania micrantha]
MCYSSEHHHDIEQVCHCKLLQVGFCGANLVDLAVMLMCGFSVQLFSQSCWGLLTGVLSIVRRSSCEEVSERDHVYGVGVTKVDNRQEKTQEWT